MATQKKRQQHGAGSRKIGNNKAFCEKYRREHRREKNKVRKLKRLYRKQPNNYQLVNAIKHFESLI